MVKAGERAYIVEGLPEALSLAWTRCPFDTASDQWAAGLRRLEEAPAEQRPVLERVTRQIEAELRRRLGGPFTSQELADLYDAGTGWTSDLAYALAPGAALRLGRPGRRPTPRSRAICARRRTTPGGRRRR